jgi:ParB-like chromosome segregation protein Spo0J
MLIKIEKIILNPLNPNVMPDDVRLKLKNNIIEQGGKYPPLILRDLKNGTYRLIDGHNRLSVLKDLGNKEVNCEVWDIDDKTEYLLLATLNELKGTQDLTKRAVLLDTLTSLGVDRMKILKLIPEDSRKVGLCFKHS